MSPTLSHKLHLSLARELVRNAVSYYHQAREDAWFLNQDQIDQLRQYADEAKRDARAHIAAARGAVEASVVPQSCHGGSDDRPALETHGRLGQFYRMDEV